MITENIFLTHFILIIPIVSEPRSGRTGWSQKGTTWLPLLSIVSRRRVGATVGRPGPEVTKGPCYIGWSVCHLTDQVVTTWYEGSQWGTNGSFSRRSLSPPTTPTGAVRIEPKVRDGGVRWGDRWTQPRNRRNRGWGRVAPSSLTHFRSVTSFFGSERCVVSEGAACYSCLLFHPSTLGSFGPFGWSGLSEEERRVKGTEWEGNEGRWRGRVSRSHVGLSRPSHHEPGEALGGSGSHGATDDGRARWEGYDIPFFMYERWGSSLLRSPTTRPSIVPGRLETKGRDSHDGGLSFLFPSHHERSPQGEWMEEI